MFASLNAFGLIAYGVAESKGFRDWSIVGDHQAGSRSVSAYDWARFADTFLIVVEPTHKSALAAHRIGQVVRSSPGRTALFVANKASRSDTRWVEEVIGEPTYATIPPDSEILAADREGRAPIDHAPSSPGVLAIERILDGLTSTR